jgi:tetratricopeptide (TPR) repeat protein
LTSDAPEFQFEEVESINQRSNASMLDRYLYILFIRDFNPRLYFKAVESFLIDYPESAVSIYLKMQNKIPVTGILPIDQLQDFAEFLFRHGAALIDDLEYSQGIRAIERSVELIPNHTEALKLLGSTYLYTLEHFQKALESYSRAVDIDPFDIASLLGKAVSLHYLGENLESNRVIDQMFVEMNPRWNIMPKGERPYYMGQGYYFRAYNFYLIGSKQIARQWVDRALEYQPEDDGPHYLSGVLYFEEQEFEKAETEFRKVIEQGTSLCDSYFRLGKIESFRNSLKSFELFRANKYCLERTIQRFDDAILNVATLNLDRSTREEIRDALIERKNNIVNQAIASAFNMINTAKSLGVPDSEQFVVAIEEFWHELSKQKLPPN